MVEQSMIRWENTSPEDRLILWRSFRKSLEGVALQKQIQEIANFFARTPISARSVDYYTPSSWPTPWEILHYGKLCQSSISILMYHTFTLLDAPESNAKLCLIDDSVDRYLVLVVDGRFVLNYELGAISEWEDFADRNRIIKHFDQTEISQII